MMKSRWLWGLPGILAVVMLATGLFWPSGLEVHVAEVKQGSICEYVDEQAITRLPRLYRVTMPQAGRIAEITSKPGDAVAKGEVVAQMISQDLANSVAEARAVVERLAAAIVENDDTRVEANVTLQARQFVDSMTNTVEAAGARTEASSKRAEFAETNLGRVRDLSQSNASTQYDLDRANLAYWEGQLGYRQDQLVLEAMKSIRSATALLPQMVEDYIARKSLRRAILEKQKSEAEARLQRMLTEQERGSMRSPVDGIVLERRIENEQQLAAGTELLVIGDLSDLEVETDLLSQEAVRIATGGRAVIYGPALGVDAEHGKRATVSRIYPAGFTKISSLGVEQQRVKVILRFEDEKPSTDEPSGTALADGTAREGALGVHYRVRSRIFTAEQPRTLLVPRSSLFRGPDGGWQLFRVDRGRARLRSVEAGLINDQWVEIRKGVQRGDQVILAPDTDVYDSARVDPLRP